MKNKEIFVLLLISCVLIFSGIKWGLPSKDLNKLYFKDEKSIKKHIERIKEYSLEKIYKGMGPYLSKHPEEEKEKLPRSYYNPIRSYHPDEYFVIKSLASMDIENLNFNPHQFAIGGAYLYLVGFLIFIFSKLNLIILKKDLAFYFFNPEEITKFYICGRTLTGLYGAGIIVLIYLIGKKIYKNKYSPLLASLFTLFTPLFILNSHYMYVDIPAVFWCIFSLFFTIKFIENFSPKYLIAAGIFCGLSAGTKFTLISSLFIPLSGLILSRKFKPIFVILIFISFLLSFSITNPYFILTFPDPLIEMSQHTKRYLEFSFYLISLKYGIGLPVLIFSFLSFIVAFKIKEKKYLLILLWNLFYFFFISIFFKKFARYILPIVPTLILSSIFFWDRLYFKQKIFNIMKNLTFIFVFLFTFIYGMCFEILFIKENVRTIAGKWINENIKENETIGVVEVPWQFQIPPLDFEKYKIVVIDYNIEKLKKEKPKYLILSSFQSPLPPYPLNLENKKIEFYNKFLKEKLYKEEKKFFQPYKFLFFTFKAEKLPEDLIYLNPTIVIYKRNEF